MFCSMTASLGEALDRVSSDSQVSSMQRSQLQHLLDLTKQQLESSSSRAREMLKNNIYGLRHESNTNHSEYLDLREKLKEPILPSSLTRQFSERHSRYRAQLSYESEELEDIAEDWLSESDSQGSNDSLDIVHKKKLKRKLSG